MPNVRFVKQKRLLTTKDYTAVFENRIFKVGSRQFLVLAKPSESNFSRLGLVVTKKNSKRSVDRNSIKRIVRESFRKRSFSLPVDIIVLTRPDINQLNKKALAESINFIWERLDKNIRNLKG